MAAVTVTSQNKKRNVLGDRRVWMGVVNVANNGDTLTVPGLKLVQGVSVDSSSTTAVGATIATNVITFVTAGALTGVLVTAIGI